MIIIRSVIFNFILIVTILLMGLLAFPLLIGSRKGVCWLRDRWVRFIILSLKLVVGLDYRVEGLENLPKGRFMVASKHQSAWETLALHLIFPDPSIVLKKELLKLPILGRFIEKVGMVPIDRSGRTSALKSMLFAARRWASIGRANHHISSRNPGCFWRKAELSLRCLCGLSSFEGTSCSSCFEFGDFLAT